MAVRADRGGREIRHVYKATPRAVVRARHVLLEFVREMGVDPQSVRRISLALTEACSNVVVHAYRDRDTPGEFLVVASEEAEHLVIQVIDRGVGLVPRFDSPGAGLGLPLMSQLSDEFEAKTSEAAGTEICMRFDLSTRSVAGAAASRDGGGRSSSPARD